MASKPTEQLESILHYRFSDPGLLQAALTHRSFANETTTDVDHNERLEYLGDVVLSLIVASALFRIRPVLTEGDMTRMRAEVVSEASLAEIASGLGLGDYLRLGRGEEKTGGREKSSLLSDALEALFGAVYMDSDFSIAESVILRLLKDEIELAVSGKRGLDAKTRLQEILQSQGGLLPLYTLTRAEGPDHDRCYFVDVAWQDKVMGRGSGSSKKRAEQSAANDALKHFRNRED